MTGLALVIEHHAQALEYDLMTRTGRTLAEYMEMGAAGAVALVSFVRHLPRDSATWRESHPSDDSWPWVTAAKTNTILADLFDALVAVNTRKGRRPKPYPRPRAGGRSIGSGAIRVRDFDEWWNSGS